MRYLYVIWERCSTCTDTIDLLDLLIREITSFLLSISTQQVDTISEATTAPLMYTD